MRRTPSLIFSALRGKPNNMEHWFLGTSLLLSLVAPSILPDLDPTFLRLAEVLERSGFTVILDLPPQWGTYGLLDLPKRSIWINPVVFDLEIARPTLVHEAVHAAQLCYSEGLAQGSAQKNGSISSIDALKPLGLGLTPSPLVRPYILQYSDSVRRQVELEAYAVQAEADGIDRAIALVNAYCQ